MTFNRESLLIATQWEEPKDRVADIRKSFPDIEVNFFKAPPGRWELGADTIPKGREFLYSLKPKRAASMDFVVYSCSSTAFSFIYFFTPPSSPPMLL
jgi:hypothetical protein